MSDIVTLNGYNIKDEKAVRSYETVASMKADTKLKEGYHVKTKGYYEANDGGNGEYVIVDDETLVDDGGSIHVLTNGLRAKLIINETINNMQLGINEELTSENLALITSNFNDLKIITDLEISSYLSIENLNIIGESKTITLTGDDKTIIHFKNCDVKGLNFTSSTFKFIDFTNSNIDSCTFYQCGLQKPRIDNTSFKVSNCYFDLNNINDGTLSEEAIHIINCSMGEISNNKFVNSKQDFIDLYPGGKNIEIFGNEFTCTNVAMEIKVILADEGDPEGGSNLHNLHNENINIHDNVFNWNINSNSQTYLIVAGLQVDRRADTSTTLDFYLHNITIHNNTFNVTSEVGVSGNYNIIWTKEVKGLVFYDNLIKNHAQQVALLYIDSNSYSHNVYSVVELLNNTFITDNNCISELCTIKAASTITAENNMGLSHLSVSSSSVVNDTHIILKNNRHGVPENYTRVYGEYVYLEGDNLDKIQFYATNLFLKNIIQVGNTGNTNLKAVTNMFISDSKIHKLNVSDPVVNVVVTNTIYDNSSPFLSSENITTKQESSVITYSGS